MENDIGIRCPKCACRHLEVSYGRPKLGRSYVRKKQCRNCGCIVLTRETAFGGRPDPEERSSTGVTEL